MAKQVDAVVLVGGKGTRLRPLTLSAPKPMLPTAGLPFLTHLLSRIAAAGIEHVILGTSYKPAVFEAEFGDGSKLGLQIDYVTEQNPLGTGGGIANVAGYLRHDTAMVFNGDVLSGARSGPAAGLPQRAAGRPDAAPGAGRRPAGFRLRSDRRTAASQHFWRRPKIRRPTRSTPAATCSPARPSIASRAAARSRSSVRCFPRCCPTESRCAATSTPATGATWAPRKTSSVDRPTWCVVSRRRRRWAATAASSWCTTVRRSRPARCSSAARLSVAAPKSGLAHGWTVRSSSTACASRPGSVIERSIIGFGARIGPRALIRDGVIGDGADIGARCELLRGARVWPGVSIPDGGIRYSSDV